MYFTDFVLSTTRTVKYNINPLSYQCSGNHWYCDKRDTPRSCVRPPSLDMSPNKLNQRFGDFRFRSAIRTHRKPVNLFGPSLYLQTAHREKCQRSALVSAPRRVMNQAPVLAHKPVGPIRTANARQEWCSEAVRTTLAFYRANVSSLAMITSMINISVCGSSWCLTFSFRMRLFPRVPL